MYIRAFVRVCTMHAGVSAASDMPLRDNLEVSVRRSVGELDVAAALVMRASCTGANSPTSYYTRRPFFFSLAIKCVPTFIKLRVATGKYGLSSKSLKILARSCGVL